MTLLFQGTYMKEYKVLTQKDELLSGKFAPESLEKTVNMNKDLK
jgi:hypothetical protein